MFDWVYEGWKVGCLRAWQRKVLEGIQNSSGPRRVYFYSAYI